MVLALEADGAEIITSRGWRTITSSNPLQEAFVATGAMQCGFCTPGILISSRALLDRNPDPTEHEIRDALVGNLCRCTGYTRIIDAVKMAAEQFRHRDAGTTDQVSVAIGILCHRSFGGQYDYRSDAEKRFLTP